ncbi:tetratricopeptide repeat, variant 2 [Chamberlinius hualienensis]
MKAILRAAKCCEQLKNHEEGVPWCDMGLNVDNGNEELKRIKSALEKEKKLAERNERKNRIASRKLDQEEENILKTIKERGIHMVKEIVNLSSYEPCHPAAHGTKVHLNETGHLIWPVLLMYPEYGQTDFIQQFNENDCFAVHLETMFGDMSEKPSWDSDGKYIPTNLKIYFEGNEDDTLWEVHSSQNLGEVLKHHSYQVQGGTPAFIIVVQSSVFHQQFLKYYKNVKPSD